MTSTMHSADPTPAPQPSDRRKLRIATTSLAGCFGCHMSILDIDERILDLIQLADFDRSPITDIKHVGPCDLGIIEGGVCNSENVEVLREFRRQCKVLVSIGACAVNGGLPALRNNLSIADILNHVYHEGIGLAEGSQIPDDAELPLPLNKVYPIHEVVKVDYFLPGCPPSGDAIWAFLTDLIVGKTPTLGHQHLHYD